MINRKMINRQTLNWILAIALSLALHAGLFMQFGAQTGIENANQGKLPLLTRLTFYKPSPAQLEPVAESAPLETPLKHVESVSQPRNKPVKKNRNEQDVIKPDVVKEDELFEQAKLQTQGQLAENTSALLLSEQQAYMQQLLAHIESKKFYPRSARSRGLEGDVEVSFELMADGRISSLSTAGGHSILQRSARQAVENSIPLPLPPVNSVLPRRVAFTIQYKLQK